MQYTAILNHLSFYEVHPKPTVEDLEKHYREKYYQDGHGLYQTEYSPDELRWFHNLAKVSLETTHQLGLDKCLLDLGCGEGYFTKAFQSFGWEVTCCDFSDFGIKRHNPDMMRYFTAGNFNQFINAKLAAKASFGLVNLQNVLEHVLNPVELLMDLKALVSAQGAVRIKVPNDFSSFQEELVKSGLTTKTWFTPPEHLSYFNSTSLVNLLEYCGYRLLSLQTTFPIEIFLANEHSHYWLDRTRGKGAQRARIFCENHLIEKSIPDFIKYSEAAAKLSFGRELIAYATPLMTSCHQRR
jgi:2-polyprenyl-3-methyl-5-hydroxy-6-metoxy-1,4-benzoquinol methylase